MAGQGLSEQMARRRGQRGKGNSPGIGENDEGPPAAGAGTQRFPGGPGPDQIDMAANVRASML